MMSKRNIKRIYHDYRNWECFHNKMYEERAKEESDFFVQQCKELLCDKEELKKQMLRTTEEWYYSTENFMTIRQSNRQAWLGQAACNIKLGATETEVRMAWKLLTEEQMAEANKIADEIIDIWEDKYFEERT